MQNTDLSVAGAVAESGLRRLSRKELGEGPAGSNPARSAPYRESEADFQKRVIKLLQDNGWLVHAERPARSAKGWVTPIQGQAGWPDIAAIHPVEHLFWLLELKAETGKLNAGQEKWLLAASQCRIDAVIILRPSDFADFEEKIKEVDHAGNYLGNC